ncbi:MAG: hypothetical protein V4610_15620 [Pseudomonadota bacterium]|jgi:hypothetical protein
MPIVDEAIKDVIAAMKAHTDGCSAPFSTNLLSNVLAELRKMKASADYLPTYPRFLLDREDAAQPLGEKLIEIGYHRRQSVKRRR